MSGACCDCGKSTLGLMVRIRQRSILADFVLSSVVIIIPTPEILFEARRLSVLMYVGLVVLTGKSPSVVVR